jgi:ATP diphosphatase
MPSRPDISRLIEIMAALRTPGTGCPWDLEQDFASIAPYTIEEAYEVADAIERGDLAELKDELGDLLLQVVYHSRMAEERHAFAFADVVAAVCAKMVRRHPHVFAADGRLLPADHPARATATPGFWERVKAAEKAEKQAARERLEADGVTAHIATKRDGVLAGVPVGLPALTRAIKLQGKAARVGFDWPSVAPVFAKMKEEIAELETEALAADPRGETPSAHSDISRERIEEEFGDVLFVMANVARHLNLDPEKALRVANAKFERRFAHIETRLAETRRTPAQSSLEEMDRFWDEARAADKTGTR